jgi:hypothetical protein
LWEGWDAEAVRWERRDVEAEDDEAGSREMGSRVVALGLDICGILIGWGVAGDGDELRAYAAC